MGIINTNNKRDEIMNKEAKQKDGFGLPSTDIRKKDNALVEAARIADKMAKWYAEFGPFKEVPKIEDVVIEEPKGPSEAELKAIEDEKKAILEAKAAKVKELKAALAEAEKA